MAALDGVALGGIDEGEHGARGSHGLRIGPVLAEAGREGGDDCVAPGINPTTSTPATFMSSLSC